MEPVTQWVQVTWTKASRGGREATTRNAAPAGLLLPIAAAPLTHDVTMREEEGFRPESSYETSGLDAATGRLRHGSVKVRPRGDALSVRLMPFTIGYPPRRRRPPALLIGPGDWVRWVINYRFSGYRGWSYSQVTVNLANGKVPLETFLGHPTRTVDDRVSLF
ncbi:hypothetical protein KIH74_17445 [Kineosporia sp. J2-2]|uniref:Uncharacterized protein n=1 Tax=Kineosporia corallincola TaxID=2835133 RepID=A0ABS5TI35_9ACTN|nr:hypothetical protein [Kineosporia corallincola]MBT0770732.1 hypothetical protein [Kineosporia corallincola]